jgi:hypothetical protein
MVWFGVVVAVEAMIRARTTTALLIGLFLACVRSVDE